MSTTVKIQLSNGSPCPTTSTTTPIVIPTTSATTTTSNSDLLAGQYEKQKTQKVQTVESIKSIPALIKAEEVEKFVTGPTNPLHDISRPVQTTNIQDTVLIQAKDIKNTLERIFIQDCTARRHNFPYSIFEENAKLLRENGFSLKYYGEPVITEVSWETERKFLYTIPV